MLFLISVHAYVNSRVQDSKNLTPLHLAVDVGSEIIVRNLVRFLFIFTFEVNRYRGSNSVILFMHFFLMGSTLRGKNWLLREKIRSLGANSFL